MHKALIIREKDFAMLRPTRVKHRQYRLTMLHMPSGEDISWTANSSTGTKRERAIYRRALLVKLKAQGWFRSKKLAVQSIIKMLADHLVLNIETMKALLHHVEGVSCPSTNIDYEITRAYERLAQQLKKL